MSVFLSAVALFAAGPATASLPFTAASAVSEKDAPAAKDEIDLLFERFTEHLQQEDFGKALNVAAQIEKGAFDDDGRAIAMAMRAGALLGLKRNKQAEALFTDADKLAPQQPAVSGMQMSMALWFDNATLGLQAVDRMIGRLPDAVREIEPQLIYGLLRAAPDTEKARNDDRTIALARLGFGAQYGDGMAANAVEVLVARGDLNGAADMLRYVDEPDELQNLLIRKRFAAFWPAVEAHAGPNLSKAIQSNVESAAREYAADTGDWVKFANYGESLRLGGRAKEAAALQEKLPATPEAITKIDEKAGWAMNNIAYALRDAGRLDDADRLYASLNEAAIPNGQWRVNMIINRVAMLVEGGQFERALPLLAAAEQAAKSDGNQYARQLVRSIQYCAYRRAGKADLAARVRAEMLKFVEDARGATIDKLVCAGDFDEAEKLSLEGLSDEDFHSSFVRNLQRRPLAGEDPVVWAEGWKTLRQRPAIAQAFDRIGRDLPDYLHPAH